MGEEVLITEALWEALWAQLSADASYESDLQDGSRAGISDKCAS